MDFEVIMHGLKKTAKDLSNAITKQPRNGLLKKSLEVNQQAVRDAIYCMTEYVDPWSCPDCGFQAKIPPFPQKKRTCPQCHGENFFPYAYLEQERMDAQMRELLAFVSQCAKADEIEGMDAHKISILAKQTLQSLPNALANQKKMGTKKSGNAI